MEQLNDRAVRVALFEGGLPHVFELRVFKRSLAFVGKFDL